jgi:Holliday junction DNA helicase RuvA
MYEYFEGKLAMLEPTQAVVDCGGVGYLLEITLNTYESLRKADESKVKVYAHLAVREDAQQLYGFYDLAEREMFRLLIGVNGVGNQTARVMLSSLTVDELRAAIQTQDVKKVQRVKGIGAKTAQRIVLELKDKVMKSAEHSGIPVSVPAAAGGNSEEAMAALLVLGYSQSEAAAALRTLDPSLPSSELIRLSLMQLGKHLK